MTGIPEATAAPEFRVLVVDDNRDAADSLSQQLRAWGFDVRVARDGTEAFQAVQDYRPDCVLADLGSAGIDGSGWTRQVRQDESLQGLTLVAFTAPPMKRG